MLVIFFLFSFPLNSFYFFFLVPLIPEPVPFVWPVALHAAARGPPPRRIDILRTTWLGRADAVIDRLLIRDPALSPAVIGRLRTLIRLTIVEVTRLPGIDEEEYCRQFLSDLEWILLPPTFLFFLHSHPNIVVLGRRLFDDFDGVLPESGVTFSVLASVARNFPTQTDHWRERHRMYIAAEGFVPLCDQERVPYPSPSIPRVVIDPASQLTNRFNDWVRFRVLPRRVSYANAVVQGSEFELALYLFYPPGRFPDMTVLPMSGPSGPALKYWLVVWWRVSNFETITISTCMRWLGHSTRSPLERAAFISACVHGPAAWAFSLPVDFSNDVCLCIADGWEWERIRDPDFYYNREHERHLRHTRFLPWY